MIEDAKPAQPYGITDPPRVGFWRREDRVVLTPEMEEECVRHLSSLDYSCIFGRCYHPACAPLLPPEPKE